MGSMQRNVLLSTKSGSGMMKVKGNKNYMPKKTKFEENPMQGYLQGHLKKKHKKK